LESLLDDIVAQKLEAQEEASAWKEKCLMLEEEVTEGIEEAVGAAISSQLALLEHQLEQKANEARRQIEKDACQEEANKAICARDLAEERSRDLESQLAHAREERGRVEAEAAMRIQAAQAMMEKAVLDCRAHVASRVCAERRG